MVLRLILAGIFGMALTIIGYPITTPEYWIMSFIYALGTSVEHT